MNLTSFDRKIFPKIEMSIFTRQIKMTKLILHGVLWEEGNINLPGDCRCSESTPLCVPTSSLCSASRLCTKISAIAQEDREELVTVLL